MFALLTYIMRSIPMCSGPQFLLVFLWFRACTARLSLLWNPMFQVRTRLLVLGNVLGLGNAWGGTGAKSVEEEVVEEQFEACEALDVDAPVPDCSSSCWAMSRWNRASLGGGATVAARSWRARGVRHAEIVSREGEVGAATDQLAASSAVKACARLRALEEGRRIHAHLAATGFDRDVVVGTALLDMYAKCGLTDEARRVFDRIQGRNVVSWTAMIVGYSRAGQSEEAVELYGKMENEGLEPDVYLGNTLITLLSKRGDMIGARRVFERMRRRDVISWSSLMSGYVKNGESEVCLKLFARMEEMDLQPSKIMFLSLLNACASLAALEQGRDMHARVRARGFESDVLVSNAVIDMYAKCGSIQDAVLHFRAMPERDVVSWNTMMAGYAKHGCAQEALKLFSEMQQEGVKVDDVSFLAVLTACSYVGLVDEAFALFHAMMPVHGVAARAEHYACMVDLLGRAGRLEEAEDFVANMPCAPSLGVWKALLGACRIHSNVQLAKYAAEQVLKVHPEDSTAYVLLGHTYMASDKVEEEYSLRTIMRSRGLRKAPGCSWIEVQNCTHVFGVQDHSHPCHESIYKELQNLSMKRVRSQF